MKIVTVNTERDELVDYRQKLKMLKELKEIIKHPYDLTENTPLQRVYHFRREVDTTEAQSGADANRR